MPTHEIEWVESYESGLERVQQLKKLMLLEFYDEKVPPSHQLRTETWNDPRVTELAGEFVCTRIDVWTNKETVKKYDVTRVPTILFLEPNGDELMRVDMFLEPEEMADMLQKALEKWEKEFS